MTVTADSALQLSSPMQNRNLKGHKTTSRRGQGAANEQDSAHQPRDERICVKLG